MQVPIFVLCYKKKYPKITFTLNKKITILSKYPKNGAR